MTFRNLGKIFDLTTKSTSYLAKKEGIAKISTSFDWSENEKIYVMIFDSLQHR